MSRAERRVQGGERPPVSRALVRDAIASLKGGVFADRFAREPMAPRVAPRSPDRERARDAAAAPTSVLHVHPSHAAATALLEPYRAELGPAYLVLHAIARWSIEHASPDDPAPHLLTTLWTLSEITGKHARTLTRHLSEDGHRWSAAVRRFIDVRHNLGVMRAGEGTRPCVVGTVIRFFPQGRKSVNARVKRYGQRDLLADSRAGCTRPTRPAPAPDELYQRRLARMSPYSPVTLQTQNHHWVLHHITRSGTPRSTDLVNLYGDIPKQHLLNALRGDLAVAVEVAEQRGRNVWRARHRWVEVASRTLAHAFGDDRPAAHPAPDGMAGGRPAAEPDGGDDPDGADVGAPGPRRPAGPADPGAPRAGGQAGAARPDRAAGPGVASEGPVGGPGVGASAAASPAAVPAATSGAQPRSRPGAAPAALPRAAPAAPPPNGPGDAEAPRDGSYTGLWRKLLWASVRAEAVTGDERGWALLQRMCALAVEAAAAGKRKPVAWAWTLVKRDGFEEILRDNALPDGSRPASGAAGGEAGEGSAAPPGSSA